MGSTRISSQVQGWVWKKENTKEALKCWNLERIIDAKSMGVAAPVALTLNDLLNEEETKEDNNVDEE